MTLSYKTLVLIVLIAAFLGGVITRMYAPKEITKIQTIDHNIIQNKIITVIKEKDNKDGSKDIETTITDNTKTTETKKTDATQVISTSQNQWFVSVGAGIDGSQGITNLTNPIYELSVDRRILGPLYIGAWVTTKTQVGLSIGMEF